LADWKNYLYFLIVFAFSASVFLYGTVSHNVDH